MSEAFVRELSTAERADIEAFLDVLKSEKMVDEEHTGRLFSAALKALFPSAVYMEQKGGNSYDVDIELQGLNITFSATPDASFSSCKFSYIYFNNFTEYMSYVADVKESWMSGYTVEEFIRALLYTVQSAPISMRYAQIKQPTISEIDMEDIGRERISPVVWNRDTDSLEANLNNYYALKYGLDAQSIHMIVPRLLVELEVLTFKTTSALPPQTITEFKAVPAPEVSPIDWVQALIR